MLKVGVHDLPAAHVGVVRALVKLLSQSGSHFPWTFSNEGPYDALIVDSQSPCLDDDVALQQKSRIVSVLGRTQRAVPQEMDVLEWPLNADRLEFWLTRVERRLGKPVARPAAITAAPALATSYKLKRWPPSELLHKDAQRIRLATLMTKRHVAETDLVRLSGQPAERCRTFVQLMLSFGLLDVQSGQPAASPVLALRPPSGLIQSIRRRLGL